MSNKSKKLVRARRRLEKAKAKIAKKALYASYAAAGKDKSKRQVLKSKRSCVISVAKHQHLMANCGNPGCRRCKEAHHA